MGRAPCCDKVGLKKGPWTPEEDDILISFIHQHGHTNWRALPKQAGLLRCGKSCRLRWINYLKPDIKRGNFTKEEEDTIIQLHEMMGNRWSIIAARLPGRTDNEIKNIWHTHLKKRLQPQAKTAKNVTITKSTRMNNSDPMPTSSQQSYTSDGFSSITEVSSVNAPSNTGVTNDEQILNSQPSDLEYFSIIDESFWSSQDVSLDNNNMDFVLQNVIENNNELQFSLPDDNTPRVCNNFSNVYNENGSEYHEDNMDFWYDVFVKAGGGMKLPEF